MLLGDPNQLAQVSQGSHPPGANASVLQHLLGGGETVGEGMGLFLGETYRMRPEVNEFISTAFYERRLEPAEVCLERSLADGNGIRFLPVEHEGNRTLSPEEADAVAAEIERLVGTPYTDENGERELRYDEFQRSVFPDVEAELSGKGQKIPNPYVAWLGYRRSRRGIFYSCSRYPKCDFSLNSRPVPRPCPKCGAVYLLEKETKREGAIEVCNNPDCGYRAARGTKDVVSA